MPIPAQFIAKLYTEGLGRSPDRNGFVALSQPFQRTCTIESMETIAIGFLESEEARLLPYSPADRINTYYRSILNRDADPGGLAYWVAQYRLGVEVPRAIAKSAEARAYFGWACGGFSQGFNSQPIVPTMPQSVLQDAIDNLPSNGILSLAPRTVVVLDRPLNIGRGKTIETTGNPSPTTYAMQARIVRGNSFSGPMVNLLPGAVLRSLWIDGQRSRNTYIPGNYNVRAQGGDGTAVINSKLSDTAGATSIEYRNAPDVLEVESDRLCRNNMAIGNLITSYSSSQSTRQWADGLSIHCEGTTAQYNAVIDATDVGIIIFNYLSPWRSGIDPQASQVQFNQVIDVGNNAFAAYGVDPFFTWERINNKPAIGDPIGIASRSFVGAKIENNLLWTAGESSFEIGLAIGTRPWFGVNSYSGRGGSYSNNSGKIRSDFGIVVSGMLDVLVVGNDLAIDARDVSLCPYTSEDAARRGRDRSGNIGLGVGFASGNIQGGAIAAPFVNCIGKRLR